MGSTWIRPRSLFSNNINGLLFGWTLWMNRPYLKSVVHSWDNRGYLKTLGSPWIRPRWLFSKIFNGLLFGWTVPANFERRSFTHSWDNSGYLKTSASRWIRCSRSSKVDDFGTNRKRVYDFLLVRNSNLGPILHRFWTHCRFFCTAPPLFHSNFGGVPVAPDGSCWRQPEQRP